MAGNLKGLKLLLINPIDFIWTLLNDDRFKGEIIFN